MPFQLLVFFFILAFSFAARAETLKDTISELKTLPLSYGTNNLRIDGKETLIVRGNFNTETASGGDVYAVLVKDKNDWKLVRYDEGTRDSILTITSPHTYEDSIISVRFLIPKESADQDSPALYLLKASRDYLIDKNGNFDPNTRQTKVIFTLYTLQRNTDFDIFYLHKLSSAQTTSKYCNADWAMNREFNIALPEKNPDQYICDDK
jgi:hypothetical protein